MLRTGASEKKTPGGNIQTKVGDPRRVHAVIVCKDGAESIVPNWFDACGRFDVMTEG